MPDLPSVEAYLADKQRAARPDRVLEAQRVFAGAFIERQRLELNIDLLREAQHTRLLAAFNTTKRVVTHRLRITDEAQLDDSMAALVAEAYEDAGPGTRGR